TIVQGNHPSCALATLEHYMFKRYPDRAMEILSEILNSGSQQFRTADNFMVDLPENIFNPEPGSLALLNGRSYASQLFQMNAANVHWQMSHNLRGGEAVRQGSVS